MICGAQPITIKPAANINPIVLQIFMASQFPVRGAP
jgi:hypothetical protein